MNNTIYGTRYTALPETGSVPLVADVSSCILSEPIDVSRFGVLYAGAQKNMAPAGLTVVIIREDLIGHARDITPTMFNYQTHADNDSMYNTPPCYAYLHLQAGAGVDEERHWRPGEDERASMRKRPALLYDFLDCSKPVQGHRGQEGPLPDEHPLCHRQRGTGRQIRQGSGRGRALSTSRAIAPWAVCGPPSTTPCRWKAWKSWSRS